MPIEPHGLQGPVVITGAAGGIGGGLVRAFLEHGYSVVAVQKPGSPGNTGSINTESAARLSFEYADLAVREEVRALSARLLKAYPSIQWLVHCAGYIATGGAEEPLEQTFEVNTFAPIILTLQCKDAIAKGGGVLFISSTAGLWGGNATPLYAASKSALHGFAFSLQKSFSPERSSIVVCPGPTNTVMREAFAHDASSHQSPDILAHLILEEIIEKEDGRDQKLFAVREGRVERISIEPSGL